MSAKSAISAYGLPTNSAITKAVAPMTGGINWPPEEADASTVPAKCGW